jgi:hypothetical protein
MAKHSRISPAALAVVTLRWGTAPTHSLALIGSTPFHGPYLRIFAFYVAIAFYLRLAVFI